MKNLIPLTFLFLLLPLSSRAQQDAKSQAMKCITEQTIAGPLEFLASDWMEGRNTGEKGAYMAADYIASMFKIYGLEPGGDQRIRQGRRGRSPETGPRSYFQNFPLLEYRTGDVSSVSLLSSDGTNESELILDPNADYILSSGTRAANLKAEIVFVGYGFKGDKYDDFKDIDVNNKVILRLQGFPGHRNRDSKAYEKFAGDLGPYATYLIEREKNQAAIEAGAVGVISMSLGSEDLRIAADNIPFRYNEGDWEGTDPMRNEPRMRLTPTDNLSALPQLTFSKTILNQILSSINIDFESFENKAEKKMQTASVLIPDVRIKVSTSVVSNRVQVRNVIGVLPGKNLDTCLVIGAHYDHLGQVRNFIYNGSDDNASGTVGVITIAKAMVESGIQPEYTLVFCAWTGEEKGLIGSAYFADHPLIPNIKCYLNYDMISRVALDDPEKNKCDFTYTSTVPLLKDLTKNHVEEYQINLDIAYQGSERPRGGSDYSSFSAKDIPIFLLHGKFTPDYHQYTDHSDKANLTYMRDIVRLGFLNIFELSTKTW